MATLNRTQQAWLTLSAVPDLGPARIQGLVERLGGARGVLDAPRTEWRRAGLGESQCRALGEPPRALMERAEAWLGEAGRHLLCPEDSDYPPLLKRIPDPPPVLWVRGDPAVLWRAQLAVVGSRNPSTGGRDNAREFCRHLARAGLVITSGLATGIDGEAHRAALEAGGATVAVAGTGLDRVYPARHKELAHHIAQAGALVSEFAPGTDVRREHFPRRNRVISGLALGVLVVEAARRSGSLITAHHAVAQGREVFAIPGSIHNPLARGCHRLIREGAKLVETAEDVIEELAPMAAELGADIRNALADPDGAPVPESGEADLDPDYQAVLEAVGWDPTPVDSVVERTGLTVGAVSSMLLILELKGLVAASSGGKYSRIPERR